MDRNTENLASAVSDCGAGIARSTPRHLRFSLPLFLALLAWTSVATAQIAPAPLGFTLGPGEVLTYDSNVLRLPSGTVAPDGQYDWSSLTSLTGKLHEDYGREDLTLSATLGHVFFKRLQYLDYNQQDMNGAFRASLPLSIEATLSAAHNTTLAHFADLQTTERDVITRNNLDGSLDLPLLADWRAVIGGEGTQTRNSDSTFKSQDFNTAQVNGGFRYQPSTGNHVDLLVRTEKGTYINSSPFSYLGPGYRDRVADLSADWTFSGANHLRGRAGYIKRTDDQNIFRATSLLGVPLNTTPTSNLPLLVSADRNFAGPAFDLTYQWQLTAVTGLRFYGLRQAGAAGDNNYQAAVEHTYRVTPSYQFSVKTELDAYVEWSRRDYFTNLPDATGTISATQRLDHARNLGLLALWNPRRWLQASVDLHHESHASTFNFARYSDTVASVQAQGTF